MLISTTKIERKKEDVGFIYTSAALTHNVGLHLIESMKRIFGGHLHREKANMDKTVDLAITKLVEQAKKLNADAIEGLKLTTNVDVDGCWIIAYGNAIKLK